MALTNLKRLLVANRGEIACRVMNSARALGLDTVAVHSEADARAKHVKFADVAVQVGSEHCVGVEVGRCGGGPAADLDRDVSEFDMLGARVGLAVDRDRVEA